jgi:hypothetical protein
MFQSRPTSIAELNFQQWVLLTLSIDNHAPLARHCNPHRSPLWSPPEHTFSRGFQGIGQAQKPPSQGSIARPCDPTPKQSRTELHPANPDDDRYPHATSTECRHGHHRHQN